MMFRRLILPALLLFVFTFAFAQSRKTAGLYYIYDDSALEALTPAPKGYKPFYISHYGRHGARYAVSEYYDSVALWLDMAAFEDALTPYGKEFREKYKVFYEEVKLCGGNLSELGKLQHRQIARRLFDRFPEVFKGQTRLDAVATEYPRVIMSMWNFITTLQRLDSSLSVSADASEKYLYYLLPAHKDSPVYVAGYPNTNLETQAEVLSYFYDTVPCDDIMARFFNEKAKNLDINPRSFISNLHVVVTDLPCIGKDYDYFGEVFTEKEDYLIWKAVSGKYISRYGRLEGSGSITPDYSAYTLENIIEQASNDIDSGNVQLRLRFGHDSGILPLITLMDVNGLGRTMSSLDEAAVVYPDYLVPMASSLQFVFYRSRKGNVILKVLFNESEARLPIKEVAPSFYSWEDFKAYYLPIAAASEKIIEDKRLRKE